jgi:hypothetical protein
VVEWRHHLSVAAAASETAAPQVQIDIGEYAPGKTETRIGDVGMIRGLTIGGQTSDQEEGQADLREDSRAGFCPNCGRDLKEDSGAKFCSGCGFKLD